MTVRLDRSQDLEREVPVALERVHPLVARGARVHDQRGAARPLCLREQDRAGSAHLELEGGVGRAPDHRAAVGVEQHGRLVPRCVLELLDHELPATCGRGPMNSAERLPLLVLADGVELEPGRAAHEQPAAARRAGARVREEALEIDEAGIDEQRLTPRKRHLDALEPEGVLDHDLGRLDRIPPSRDVVEDVATTQTPSVPGEHGLARADPRDPLQ